MKILDKKYTIREVDFEDTPSIVFINDKEDGS